MKIRLKRLVYASLLLALDIVLSRFCAVTTPLVKVSFSFLPIAVCGMLFGPVWAGTVGALADLVGAGMFPVGPYFPGITLSAALTGILFGLTLHRRDHTNARAAAAALLNCGVVSLLLTSFWLHLLSGTPYLATVVARIPQALLLCPVQFLAIRLLHAPVFSYAAAAGFLPHDTNAA